LIIQLKILKQAARHRLLLYFKVLVLIPFGVFLVMALYSLLIRWNLTTSILLWFFVVPAVILFLNLGLFKTRNITWKTVASLASLYCITVYMIYDHYQSDAFEIMMFSAGYNFLVMALVMFVQWRDKTSDQRNARY
jgi:hypothetical protein